MESLRLSQGQLQAFLTCAQRFKLRYLEKLPWPHSPLDPQQASAIRQGQEFHQLLERYFLGLSIDEDNTSDRQLWMWWRRFEENLVPLPPGRMLPEQGLTIPVGEHFLTGRFDLVLIGSEKDHPPIHIYDWKTSRPRPTTDLQEEWQSRLYLALIAESKNALMGGRKTPCPDQITLTYWYVSDPRNPRTINYSAKKHEQNWAEIQLLVTEIDSCQQKNQWPLTDNWSHCRSCSFWSYCGRLDDGTPANVVAEEQARYEIDSIPFLEPDSP